MASARDQARERIRSVARAHGVELGDVALDRLVAYTAAVVETSRRVNLTAARALPDAVEILVLPSLAIGRLLARHPHAAQIVDIGSGNGFPGVVAAVLWPEATVFLVERRGRKAEGIRAALGVAGISNAEAIAADARELKNERAELMGSAQLVLARAVGPLATVCRLGAALLAPGGALVQWKASDLADHEADEGARVARARGLRVDELSPVVEDAPSPGRLVIYTRSEDAR